MITETVSGRTIPRYTGPPLTHELRFYGVPGPSARRRLIAECEPCRDAGAVPWRWVLDAGHSVAELTRFEHHHAGTEDP